MEEVAGTLSGVVGLETGLHDLPPEMVTAVLEYLEDSPASLLACRAVCPKLKKLVDIILERKHLSLWNWSKSHGESKPCDTPGPIKRPFPAAGRIFQESADIDRFLREMKNHEENGLNPFPSQGIYIRRVRSNPPSTFEGAHGSNGGMDDQSLHQLRMRSLDFFDHQNKNNSESYLLPVPKILGLLETFGTHLTSFIFECGVTTELKSLNELYSILEFVPNLQCLMLKGVQIDKRLKRSDIQENELQVPELNCLKSLKLVGCTGVTDSLLQAYHNQVETLQLLNTRDFWFPHFEKLQRQNGRHIFEKLKELKLGEFERPAEFDYFTSFLSGSPQDPPVLTPQPLQKLERLSIHYSMFHGLQNHPEMLFQMLQYLPKLKELNVGHCFRTSYPYPIKPKEERSPSRVICASASLTSISLPFTFFMMPYVDIIRKHLQGISSLQEIRFLDWDNFLWSFDSGTEQTLHPPLISMSGLSTYMHDEFFVSEEAPNVARTSVVACFGDEERIICKAFRKNI